MSKLLSALLAAVFAAVTITPVAFAAAFALWMFVLARMLFGSDKPRSLSERGTSETKRG